MSKITSMLLKAAYVFVGIMLGLSAIQTSYNHITLHKQQPREFVTAAERDRQLKCLALNVYHEAGVEAFEGKVAVAQVTINRSQSNSFPSDICAVVYQKNVFLAKTVCQFSWYCIQPSKLAPTNTKAYDESFEAAKRVLLEDFRLKGIENALYYHADYVNPQWKYKRIAKIGRHIFYEGK